jgi:hypothetical protein
MDETTWLNCTDPQRLLGFLKGKASNRKLRLFAVACCRRIWHLLPDERTRAAVEVEEQYADGTATEGELEAAANAAVAAASEIGWPDLAVWPTFPDQEETGYLWEGIGQVVGNTTMAAGGDAECKPQCILLRDLLGNPFRSFVLDRIWLTPDVVRLARTAYEERVPPTMTLDADRLAVLADALEEAGCTDAVILAHLREPNPHVRGCWAIDLLLGKE